MGRWNGICWLVSCRWTYRWMWFKDLNGTNGQKDAKGNGEQDCVSYWCILILTRSLYVKWYGWCMLIVLATCGLVHLWTHHLDEENAEFPQISQKLSIFMEFYSGSKLKDAILWVRMMYFWWYLNPQCFPHQYPDTCQTRVIIQLSHTCSRMIPKIKYRISWGS